MVQISLIAKNYADALVKLGQENISYDDILKSLNTMEEIFENSQDLSDVLANPTISINTKSSVIDEIFSNDINPEVKDFLKILIQKHRFSEFNGIKSAFEAELDKINNIERVEITSAIEITEETKQKIVEKLQQKLQKNVIPSWNINDDIIAGLVIKIGNDVIDNSIKTKLKKLSKNII